ncbi:MAG: hypothetical protein M3R27_04915 [Bacteroidota bacterium]|nr:hypothetical protein [Bacteroidota bacterium]
MKKSLHLLFTFYFFIASAGIVFGTHYCGKKKSHTVWGVSFSDSNACKCSGKHPAKTKSCCKNEAEWIKADIDDSKVHSSNIQFNKGAHVIEINLSGVFSQLYFSRTTPLLSYKVSHPPPIYEQPLFLRIRSLLI